MDSPTDSAEDWLDAFRTIARRDPSRPAVYCDGTVFTYEGLERQSNAIATSLRALGLGPGDHVGVGLHRTRELPGALLGIIKSGAAYIPLDPSYPTERLAQMISSAGLRHIVTTTDLAAYFTGSEIIDLWQIPAAPEFQCGFAGNDPLYAIFTSGSTGEPKAAGVFRQGFSNLLRWYQAEMKLRPEDTTLVISSPSFDLTQKNLFAPLASGGALVLDSGRTYDIRRICELIRSHRVTLLNCTPSAFYPLLEANAPEGYAALATLRHVVLGGEPLAIPRLRPWLEHPACHAAVVNTYGPTECTDICLFHRLDRSNIDDYPYVPLGREIPGVQVTIRDESLTTLAGGALGELCISGAGVGSGYRNDPHRTAAAFKCGIYRTGDLAVRHPNGIFEFRGRADDQVKVNGHRIELGEIELALQSHPAVQEAIVTATSDRLTAHLRGSASSREVRDFLSKRLPNYMVPGEYRTVNSYPLTPNGKVDRKALAALQSLTNSTDTGSVMESKILGLWSEVLGHPVHDPIANFFDLGGNSIHLALLHVRLLAMTGRDFPITRLFALPTARAIAAFLNPVESTEAPPVRPQLARNSFSQFRRPTPR